MNTYLTLRIQGNPPIFRHFRHVRHTEALGILDPFQRTPHTELSALFSDPDLWCNETCNCSNCGKAGE